MKSGIYRVSFNVNLTSCENEDEALDLIKGMCREMLEEDSFPEANFELVDEMEMEYAFEEDEVQELNF